MAITDEKYVSITTTRKSGATVSSPVWIAALPDGTAGFTTDFDSGKVKRIRNNSAVTIQPCDSRGRVKQGTEPVTATATVVTGSEHDAVQAAVKAKYKLMYSLMIGLYKVRDVFKRSKGDDTPCAVVLRFD